MKLSFFSITKQGADHLKRGDKCQDFSQAEEIRNEALDMNMVIAAVADGVGSCEFSDEGSSIAVTTALKALREELEKAAEITETTVLPALRRAFNQANSAILLEADRSRRPYPLFDTTLTAAVVASDGTCYIGHIGDDGAVALFSDGSYRMVTERMETDLAGSVYPLACTEKWAFCKLEKPVAAVLLMTDGLLDKSVTKKQNGEEPFYPFFGPFFENPMRNDEMREALRKSVDEALDELRENRQVTDDISIVLIQLPELLENVKPVKPGKPEKPKQPEPPVKEPEPPVQEPAQEPEPPVQEPVQEPKSPVQEQAQNRELPGQGAGQGAPAPQKSRVRIAALVLAGICAVAGIVAAYRIGNRHGEDQGTAQEHDRMMVVMETAQEESRKTGFAEGREEGYTEGEKTGYASGDEAGYARGDADGYTRGKEEGYTEGEKTGYANGDEAGYARGDADGYARGKEEGYAEGEKAGYANGEKAGYTKGEETGYARGKEEGYAEGEKDGYARGEEAGKKNTASGGTAETKTQNDIPRFEEGQNAIE